MYIHAYKKYRASPLTDKKKSNSVRRRKKISSKLKIYPPRHQKSNGPPLSHGFILACAKNKFTCLCFYGSRFYIGL
jgi:hypothetical protein